MSLMNVLMDQLGGDATRQIGSQLGIDEQSTSKAIAGALPMLLGALAKNSQSSGGADALLGALSRDHDGSVLDDLAGYVSGGGSQQGDGILGHVFGGKRGTVESALGSVSGLDSGSASKLLAMLAPVVMGALGRERRSNHLDAGGLTDLLGKETRRPGGEASEAMGLVGRLLDQDGDGDFKDDIAKIGTGLLGKFLGGGR